MEARRRRRRPSARATRHARLPTAQKGAQRQVHVLNKRAGIPASGVIHALLSPYAAGAVEIEEVAGAEARVLLALDVRVQADLLVPVAAREPA